MFNDPEFVERLSRERGRYPVANLIQDHLHARKLKTSFRLGEWLAHLDLDTLEDVQTKLGTLLFESGPDHAGEDLILSTLLLSHAEAGREVDLSDDDVQTRLVGWFQAGSLEKLVRHGSVSLSGEPQSIDPERGNKTFVTLAGPVTR